MPLQIDQSNKIERTERDTVLALSNDQQRAIVIPAQIKREVIVALKNRHQGGQKLQIYLFAVGLFILLRPCLADVIRRKQQIVIDIEYEGHEDKIKSMLLRYARAAGFQLSSEIVTFARVGKSSRAHQIAWQVQRGKRAPDHCVSQNELAVWLK